MADAILEKKYEKRETKKEENVIEKGGKTKEKRKTAVAKIKQILKAYHGRGKSIIFQGE